MERLYLILDGTGQALAQAVLESPRITEVVQLRLTEETELDFLQVGEIQCIGLDNGSASMRERHEFYLCCTLQSYCHF